MVFLGSCSVATEENNVVVYPEEGAGAYRLTPNDPISGDSSMNWLARGVVIPGYPSASYTLSFLGDDGEVPDLRLFTLIDMDGRWGIVEDLVVEGRESAGRWVYEFSFSQPLAANWITSLERDGTRYAGAVRSLKLDAEGVGSVHLSFNLWVTGAYAAPVNGESPENLQGALLAGFRQYYGPAGVVIDTIHLQYASGHPLVGSRYPADIPVVAEGVEERFDSLGYGLQGTAAHALDLVLVHGFEEAGMLGESPLLGMSLQAGPVGVVVIATQQKSYSGESYEPIALQDIVGTTLHEVGHFLGLRHTTSTRRDLMTSGDASMIEDGLTDTPFCHGLLDVSQGIPAGNGRSGWSRLVATAPLVALLCPDQANLMFPFAVEGEIFALTSQQGDLLRRNIALFPHQ